MSACFAVSANDRNLQVPGTYLEHLLIYQTRRCLYGAVIYGLGSVLGLDILMSLHTTYNNRYQVPGTGTGNTSCRYVYLSTGMTSAQKEIILRV